MFMFYINRFYRLSDFYYLYVTSTSNRELSRTIPSRCIFLYMNLYNCIAATLCRPPNVIHDTSDEIVQLS